MAEFLFHVNKDLTMNLIFLLSGNFGLSTQQSVLTKKERILKMACYIPSGVEQRGPPPQPLWLELNGSSVKNKTSFHICTGLFVLLVLF